MMQSSEVLLDEIQEEKKKVQIDILLEQGYSMRKVANLLGIHHSTISRYKAGKYKKRKINIHEKYKIFLLIYSRLSDYNFQK